MNDFDHGVGYLLKDRVSDLVTFRNDVRRVAAGDIVIDPELVRRLVARARQHDPIDKLTARERAVLALMAQGLSNSAAVGGAAPQRQDHRGPRPQHLRQARPRTRRARAPPRPRRARLPADLTVQRRIILSGRCRRPRRVVSSVDDSGVPGWRCKPKDVDMGEATTTRTRACATRPMPRHRPEVVSPTPTTPPT